MAEVVENNLDRSELEQIVHADTGVEKETIHRVLSAFFQNLRRGVALTGYVELHGLGSFALITRAPREGVTPAGEPYSVGKRHTVRFEAFEDFRNDVETLTGTKCI